MTRDQMDDIALRRYAPIAPLVSGTADPSISNNEFFRQAARMTYTAPDGSVYTVAEPTLKKWYAMYRKEGLEGLMPKSRKDEGTSRKIDDGLAAQIDFLLEEYPRISASDVYRKLLENGSIRKGEVSETTIRRYVSHARTQEDKTSGKDMRRYERQHINEVWYGDSCYGPWLQCGKEKKRLFVIALIDDASRFIVGADIFFNDNFENLMSVEKSAVSRYGCPKLFSFDNGASYRNKQMELLAARIGSSVHYCEPYTPTSKAKIERWFSTMRMQFFATLDMRLLHTLEEVREKFHAYVLKYNQTPHSSLGKVCPQDRFFSEAGRIRRLAEDEIEKSFLLETERRVSADNVVMIGKTEYEVHYRYAKQKIRLRYSPGLEKVYVVEASGDLTPITLLDKNANASVKRERVHLSGGGASE